jgi:hypothetical protein
MLPVVIWYFVRHKGCCLCLSSDFGPLAYFASLHIGLYISSYCWPPVVLCDLLNSAIDSSMACDQYIMVLRDDPLSKVLDMWYQHLFVEKQNSLVIFLPFIPPLGHLSSNVSVDFVVFVAFSDFSIQCVFLF